MTVVKKPSYTAIGEHDVKLKRLRYEQAAATTCATRKCKLQASFNCSSDMLT